jgi:hypothetical protein
MGIGGAINFGVDYFVTTQVNHQEYSFERGAAMFGVGALATGAAMILAPAAATTAVGILGAEGVAATITSATTAGIVTGGINMATGASNTVVASLAEGMSLEESMQNAAEYTGSSWGRDFTIGFMAGAGSTVLEKTFTPITQPMRTIKRVNPAPLAKEVPRGGPEPRISGSSQIAANALSDIPYLYPAYDSGTSENDPPAIVGGKDWFYEY